MPVTTAPEEFPLDALLWRLIRFLPPSLTALLELLEDAEDYADFLRLVAMVLPEEEETIKQLNGAAERLPYFANRFQDRYFPLSHSWEDWAEDQEYRDLLRSIPIPYMGMDYEDLHGVDNLKAGYLLLGSLHIFDRVGYWDEGIGVVWIEAAAAFANRDDLMRLPAGGWTTADLHLLLDGTVYQAAAHFANYMENSTTNPFLDCWAEYPLDAVWELETVEWLAGEYQKSEVLWSQIHRMVDWLEEDPAAHFAQLLDFVLQRQAEVGLAAMASLPEARTLADVFGEQMEEDI